MATICVAVKLARQIEGDYVFVNALRAFQNKGDAALWLMENRFPAHEVIEGNNCVVEIGIIEGVELQ